MPRLSLRTHILLWGNLLVLVTAAAIGTAVVRLATAGAERRLTTDAAANAAGLIRELHLPLSPRLMKDLQRVHGCEFVAWHATEARVLASSLAPAEEAALQLTLADRPTAERVALATGSWVVARAEIAPGQGALLLLARQDLLGQARQRAVAGAVGVTLLAVAVASFLAWLLAERLSRPVRDLAAHLERLATATGTDLQPGSLVPERLAIGGPTEIRQLAEAFNALLAQLQGARERLAAAARLAAVGQLSASVAHELRNPLSGIKMNAHLLQEELTAAGKADPSLDIILREIARLDLYLQELLNVARQGHPRPPAATPPAAPVTARLGEVATGLEALLRGRARHARVTLNLCVPGQLPPLRIAPEALRQVLLNLLLNGLDAMPEGGTLTVTATQPAPDRVRCEVRDTGTGVHASPGTDLFAPFVSTKPLGAGLGLHISRGLIEEHGGSIGFAAAEPGTVFWIELNA